MEDLGDYPPPESLSIYLPLPYRILLIGILGVWLFSLDLHYFHVVRIDISPMLQYTRSVSEAPLHRSVYGVAVVLSLLFGLNLMVFWSYTGGNEELVKQYEILPLGLFFFIPLVFLWPFGGWHKRGRWRFLRMLRRVLLGGLDPDLRLADILLADALTSYAKVLGDLAVVFCMFYSGYSSTNPHPDRSCGPTYLVPGIISLPYLMRLRQCLTEYYRARKKGHPWLERRIHLFNAAKYASAFPVILCSALQRGHDPELHGEGRHILSHAALNRLWLMAAMFNSMYSFYWDITRDWKLTLFSSARNSEEFPYALRKDRHFVNKEIYYAAIVIDFLLRATWSIKLSPHLDFFNEMEGGLFVLELLEVFRRWVWVLLRVEKEWIVSGRNGLENGIPMGEYGKIDED
ncbi:protein-ER retention protein [Rhizina undulata]